MFKSAVLLLFFLFSVQGSRCQRNSPVYYAQLGDFQLTVMYDGPIAFTTNPFVVSLEDLTASYNASFRSTTPLALSQNVLLIDGPFGRAIIDPGSRGSQANPLLASAGLLFQNMEAAGISPDSVDYILLTHAHADHVNGLLSPSGGRAFPNAKVYIGRKEHSFWRKSPLPIPEEQPQRELLCTSRITLDKTEPGDVLFS